MRSKQEPTNRLYPFLAPGSSSYHNWKRQCNREERTLRWSILSDWISDRIEERYVHSNRSLESSECVHPHKHHWISTIYLLQARNGRPDEGGLPHALPVSVNVHVLGWIIQCCQAFAYRIECIAWCLSDRIHRRFANEDPVSPTEKGIRDIPATEVGWTASLEENDWSSTSLSAPIERVKQSLTSISCDGLKLKVDLCRLTHILINFSSSELWSRTARRAGGCFGASAGRYSTTGIWCTSSTARFIIVAGRFLLGRSTRLLAALGSASFSSFFAWFDKRNSSLLIPTEKHFWKR